MTDASTLHTAMSTMTDFAIKYFTNLNRDLDFAVDPDAQNIRQTSNKIGVLTNPETERSVHVYVESGKNDDYYIIIDFQGTFLMQTSIAIDDSMGNHFKLNEALHPVFRLL